MTRLGWYLLLAFLIVIAGFALIVRKGRGPAGTPAAAPTSAAASASNPPPLAAGAGLVMPVAGVRADQLHDTWDEARGDGSRQHHAIDILAPRGTAVVAAAAGTIEKIFESKDGGHTVYVRRGDPAFVDYYAHLDGYAPGLAEGQAVGQGQLIGTVGSSGDASPDAPHLHYEIKRMGPGEKWWRGREINPFPLLAGRPAAG